MGRVGHMSVATWLKRLNRTRELVLSDKKDATKAEQTASQLGK